MISNKKILFWDRFFWIMIGLFVIPMVLYISASEDLINSNIFSGIIGICILIAVIMLIVFRFGMVYNAYKIKRYGWLFVVLLLGLIFMIYFYFFILKKEMNRTDKNKVEN